MKTRYLLGVMALLAVSCAKEEQPVKESASEGGLTVTATTEQSGGDTKSSLDGVTVKWTAGDQIYLTDGTKNAIYQAAKSATSTTFTKVSGDDSFDDGAVIYAYYPASSVTGFSGNAFTATLPTVQTYKEGGFADGINPMTAKAAVSGGSLAFSFKNVLSIVKLQLTHTASNVSLVELALTSVESLCGTATVTVGDDGLPTTSITDGFKTVYLSGINTALTSDSVPFYIAVPVGNLGQMTISAETSETDGHYIQERVATKDLTAVRSTIYAYNSLNVGTFTNKAKSVVMPANCYMIHTGEAKIWIPLSQAVDGWNAIKALETNDSFDVTKITTGTRSIDVRWLDGTGTVSLNYINSTHMKLSLNSFTEGSNAVVDLKNGDEIVWSWHLWFTDYIPGEDNDHTVAGQVHTYTGAAFQEGGKYYGKVMMDRNLGATATGVSGGISQPQTMDAARTFYGLFYEFGRKDPFSRTIDYNKLVNVTSSKVTYAHSAQNPAEYYYTETKGDPWSSTDAARTASNMTDPWNSKSDTKSVFDPCPAGWRIPVNGKEDSSNVWTGLTADTWKTAYNSINATCGNLWKDKNDNNVWIPACGSRSATTGKFGAEGAYFFSWGATPCGIGSAYFAMYNVNTAVTASNWNQSSRAYGFAIRCVKE